jgi:CDI immunity proteins
MKNKINTFKSLSKLSNKNNPIIQNDTSLIARHNDLLTKPICEYSVEDFRLLIGQNTGLEHLIPIAMEILKGNLMAEGDFYEGDLLKAVLTSDKDFWLKNKPLKTSMQTIIENEFNQILNLPIGDKIKLNLLQAYKNFNDF